MGQQAVTVFYFALSAFVIPATFAHAGTFTLTSEAVVPNAVVVTYDSADGNLSYDGNGTLITAMELISSSEQFDPTKVNPGVISGPFDIFTPVKFFKLNTVGDTSVDIGPVLPIGLTASDLLTDMQVDGSVRPSCDLHPSCGLQYLFVVPEPSSLTLVACGVLGLLRLRGK